MAEDTLRVTLVQQPLAWHDPAANRTHFERCSRRSPGNTDLMVLPEMFPTGFSMEVEELAEPVNGPTTQVAARRRRAS